jgi:hypothetical protein
LSFNWTFLWVSLVLLPFSGLAQSISVTLDNDRFTEYVFLNDSLKVRPALSISADAPGGNLRYEVLSSKYTTAVSEPAARRFFETGKSRIAVVNPGFHRKKPVATLSIQVVTGAENTLEVLQRMHIRVWKSAQPSSFPKAALNTSTPFASGDWYKIPVLRSGIHQINRAFLQNLGIRVDDINARNIQIWAGNGYELPKENSVARPVFKEIPIIVEGESDGKFDATDRILFYQNDPHRVFYNTATSNWEHQVHHGSNSNFVFLTIGTAAGRRLQSSNPLVPTGNPVTTFKDFIWREDERTKPEPDLKSGAKWLGQTLPVLSAGSTPVFSDTLAGFTGGLVEWEFAVANRALNSSSRFIFHINGTARDSLTVSAIEDFNGVTGLAAREGRRFFSTQINAANGLIQAGIQYRHSNAFSSVGFVDYIRIRTERTLAAERGILSIFEHRGTGSNTAYLLQGFTQAPVVLDVTDPLEPVLLPVTASGQEFSFVQRQEPGRRFFAQTTFIAPAGGTKITGQSLRGITTFPDLIIVTTPQLRAKADEFASYRATRSGIGVNVVTQDEIFNEFSAGVPDFVAIRDYMRFLYQRATVTAQLPKHLLLFGDATFDYKGIEQSEMANRIFTYQSLESLDRINSYGSDDFFGLLDDNEGNWDRSQYSTTDRVDIGIGRFPVQNESDATVIINKIKTYEQASNLNDWRSVFTFVSDDDVSGSKNDTDLHLINADVVAQSFNQDIAGIRLKKIHTMNYQAQTTAFGRRFPQATADLIQAINEGTLIVNYAGHGNERTLSDEKLFDTDYLPQFSNPERLSIFVTATCSFGRFDDNERQSGAEQTVLMPTGGMVASFTTTRTVFTSRTPGNDNFGLNLDLTEAMTSRGNDGMPLTLGEIFERTKNQTPGASLNGRKFILIGDPSMRFGLPQKRAVVTSVNDSPVGETAVSLRALDRMKISGRIGETVADASFNGNMIITVFDGIRRVSYPEKSWTATFCVNNNCSFLVQNDVLFRGQATVTNGLFSLEFIVPKDIQFSTSNGRIHLYGSSGNNIDASGGFSNVRFNGINTEAANDGTGPELTAFINDTTFVDGALVNNGARLIVRMRDVSGINTAGAGIGHEMTATLNTTPESMLTLNTGYTSEKDDYRSGTAAVVLPELPAGTWSARIRAWDIFNNPGETTIRFTIAENGTVALANVYNYPNPMSWNTQFVFEHNLVTGSSLDVTIRIFTLSGKPAAVIRETVTTTGNLARIPWNGRDADGHLLANGTYLYHVSMEAGTGSGSIRKEKIEKLVIIR